jgi:predicted secreted protein
MRTIVLALLLPVLSGCVWLNNVTGIPDPHAPKTVTVGDSGGEVRLDHGQRLRIRLPAESTPGYDWRRFEPQILAVMAEGPRQGAVWMFTPVRSGQETLHLEYAPVQEPAAAPKRAITYIITVR